MGRVARTSPGSSRRSPAASPALCAELDELHGDTPEGTPDQRTAQVHRALFGDQPGGQALLAWHNRTTLAGFASYSLLWPAAGLTTSLYLKELYVSEPYRRASVGKLLMDGLYRLAAERGCSRVEWTTDTSNQAAQAFYESLGVKPLATKIFYRATDIT
jgi:ribosomal protein S18 acetylase RimI-like enzyme